MVCTEMFHNIIIHCIYYDFMFSSPYQAQAILVFVQFYMGVQVEKRNNFFMSESIDKGSLQKKNPWNFSLLRGERQK